MLRSLFLLSVLTAALVSQVAWGHEIHPPAADRRPLDEGTGASADGVPRVYSAPDENILLHCLRNPERQRRRTLNEINTCLKDHNWRAPRAFAEGAAPSWDIVDTRQACAPYMEWDPELEECVRTAEPLPPELEFFEPLNRPLVRPPGGVIVLHPDYTWTEESRCPPELIEEREVNNWRFCRDPERNDRIPFLWEIPINGIPYEEVKEIHHRHAETLMTIEGVLGVGLGINGIVVETGRPELVPEEVEGVPIKTQPPGIYLPLWVSSRHDWLVPLRHFNGSGSGQGRAVVSPAGAYAQILS